MSEAIQRFVKVMDKGYWEAWFQGWAEGVTAYAVWKDGQQVVGVMQRPLREVLEAKWRELIRAGQLPEARGALVE